MPTLLAIEVDPRFECSSFRTLSARHARRGGALAQAREKTWGPVFSSNLVTFNRK